jgi:hypothetical protein
MVYGLGFSPIFSLDSGSRVGTPNRAAGRLPASLNPKY